MQTCRAVEAAQMLAVPGSPKPDRLSLEHGVGSGTAIGYSDGGWPRTRNWRERVKISGCLFPGRRGEEFDGCEMDCYQVVLFIKPSGVRDLAAQSELFMCPAAAGNGVGPAGRESSRIYKEKEELKR
ncbi:hypothetical protein FZEAL_5803 [Fusarium zealandicum]|uniref:Uncharacterized protein n=1 Tax=Fusarium zealandicum TaxID=1053134 RepID=A0A8H4UIY6_9HYPO|nr:hypothetical protein FZEAL_5803 [Fusarium zealandicum]